MPPVICHACKSSQPRNQWCYNSDTQKCKQSCHKITKHRIRRKKMASKSGILFVAFLSLALLPWLSSAFFPGILPHHHGPFFHPGFGHMPLHNNRDDSDVLIEPVNGEQPSERHGDGASSNEPELVLPENGATPNEPALELPENGAMPNEPAPANGATPIEPAPERPENGAQSNEPGPAREGLQEAFYQQSCPQAEMIVNETIHNHFRQDPTLAAGIVRLFFHDCFVTGCDASVLLDTTPTGEEVEKKAPQNGKFLRGFQAIDDIKTRLEAECPGVVSCADILAFVNRDSLVFTGVPRYEVAGGRRDGLSSLARNAEQGLPFPDTPPEENLRLFQNKGLSLEDLVLLLGAHSIGSAHCNIVSGRFHDPVKSKEIDPGYLFKMQTMAVCHSEDQTIPFDPLSQQKMDSRYYKELLTNKALIESDHRLAKEPHSRNIMQKFADDQAGWLARFTNVMKKLGEIEVLTGNQGEIRRQCRAVN